MTINEMRQFEIYFHDLNKEAQEEFLKLNNCEEEDLNCGLLPLAIIDIDIEGDY